MLKRNDIIYDLVVDVLKPYVEFKYNINIRNSHYMPTSGPVLLLPKHQKMHDILFESYFLNKTVDRPAYWVMKSNLPFMLNMMGGIKIKRPRDILREENREKRKKLVKDTRENIEIMYNCIKSVLDGEEVLIIHPEGMRKPNEVGKIKSGLLDITRRVETDLGIRVPVIPLGIKYSFDDSKKKENVDITACTPLDLSSKNLEEEIYDSFVQTLV